MSKPLLKKKYGQHHLRSGDLCRPLVEYLGGVESEWIVEIGPGGGVLTAELLATGARVLALELDAEWAAHLRAAHPSPAGSTSRLDIVVQDALGFAWSRLPAPTRITGNLPFNVATPILDRILDAASREPERLPRLGFMVQKEVAERLVAGPGDSAYGALSVLVRARARARLLGTVAPGAFRPPPKVAAAFVGLEPIAEARDVAVAELRRVVHAAFGQRRKTLRNSLGSGYGKERAGEALEKAGIDPRARAETLDLDAFLSLARCLERDPGTISKE